ncbi:hypothetical protein LINPERHAP1_LOCUS9775 [Linum perenne]
MKITYISSPTLVRATNASEFRALVQELTGKNSRVGEEDDGIDNHYCEDNRTPEDGDLFLNCGGGDVTTVTAAEMEAGGFCEWSDVVPDAFGSGGIRYSSDCLFV